MERDLHCPLINNLLFFHYSLELDKSLKELVINAPQASRDSFLPRSLKITIFNSIKNLSQYIMPFQNIELIQICFYSYTALNNSFCLKGLLSL